MPKFIGALASLSLIVSSPALAWGQNGHRIIGEIAENRLSERTQAQIDLILSGEDLAEVSTWADEERSNPSEFWQKQAGPWHYVTIPAGTNYEDMTPPAEGDAITALERFTADLRDPDTTPEERRLALLFIVHIVGDLHQPLHAGNGTDRGGNDRLMRWYGQATNLHSVWDTQMIQSERLSYTEYAARPDRQISSEETLDWWEVRPAVWVNESAAIRDRIYPSDDGSGATNLGWGYKYQHLPTAEKRLQQAGVRLAAYLDWVFSSQERG